MREILFRGKCIEMGEKCFQWIEGFYAEDDGKPLIAINKENGLNGSFVDLSTVGQFTGLTDKNGKRIFGGDIIKAAEASPEYSLVVIRDEGYGFFNDYYFGGEWHDTEPISDVDWFVCDEVIGNIYDNPELLEVTE